MSPYKPARPCRVPTCPGLATVGGYCSAHQGLRPKPRPRPSRHDRGYDSAWEKVRAAYLVEHPECEYRRMQAAVIVHHVQPLLRGGPSDESNLQALCRYHHGLIEAKRRPAAWDD